MADKAGEPEPGDPAEDDRVFLFHHAHRQQLYACPPSKADWAPRIAANWLRDDHAREAFAKFVATAEVGDVFHRTGEYEGCSPKQDGVIAVCVSARRMAEGSVVMIWPGATRILGPDGRLLSAPK